MIKSIRSIVFIAIIMLASCTNNDDNPPEIIPEIKSINEFISVEPQIQNTDFVFPLSHTFQKIIETGDVLTAGGTLPPRNDFTGYVPIEGSSINGYLSINSETTPGGVSVLDINLNSTTQLWEVTYSEAVDFSNVGGTINNCSGTVTPWNTIISCEERIQLIDDNMDGYNDFGWAVEIDPVNKKVIDKRWALGNFAHENAVIHNNERTLYQGADSNPGYLFRFVAHNNKDLSSGDLYVYVGSKEGAGNWVRINNTTIKERNTTIDQSEVVGATVFNGIEDVEIAPDGMVYFAVKGEDTVYRFLDSDPINGLDVSMETFVGDMEYTIAHEGGETSTPWGTGNDNLAFDGDGNLWVLQDGSNNNIWVVEKGHTQDNPKIKLFGIAPLGAEATGITFSPDYNYLFMSIQGADATNNSSEQIDAAGNSTKFDNHISLVMALNENLGN
ncbi:alkaline phosphatase PhoX [uncultured Maribacter sp.]|uniref:PhoX family protein n=1 Tax=uncultured Maribacter sp. TaxID=431308 RepID=UPI0030EED073|tara:strand:+ start:82179 stop:83507 length:1329 start_codon:yes stop_codon:yes gene_type:complete